MTSYNINESDIEIQKYRSNICKVFIKAMAFIAIPAVFASLYRITDIGWQPVMAFHALSAILLWLIALLQNRISYNIQAGFIVFISLGVGLGGIYQFGLIAGGVSFLVTAGPIAALLFGGRTGIIILVAGFTGTIILSSLIVSATLVHQFDITSYAVSLSSWATSIFGWLLTSAALTVSIMVFNQNLIDALKSSIHNQQALQAQQLILQKAIEEKEKALSEVRTLQGIIPICSYCHSIRTDEGAWDKLEAYISRHSNAMFSHGICPKCIKHARDSSGLGD